jgi:spore maturation protein CgeB
VKAIRGVLVRILAMSTLADGANDFSFVRAFRRAGHSVVAVSPDWFVPRGWRPFGLRALRRALTPVLVREYNAALVAAARAQRPDLFFVFKGTYVTGETVSTLRAGGAVAINFFPDISFLDHGPWIPKAVPHYDWIFTTKSFGIDELRTTLGFERASFLPHAFDPEIHAPIRLSASDTDRLGCDISFIGSWSPKKESLLAYVAQSLPHRTIRIWGENWGRSRGLPGSVIEGHPVFGTEYAKAIRASKVCLALLHEATASARSGDLMTARTFEIPAAGGFMLHERNEEVARHFKVGRECAVFDGAEDLVAKIEHYVARPDERAQIAEGGRRRSLISGYSVDRRVEQILDKVGELRAPDVEAA